MNVKTQYFKAFAYLLMINFSFYYLHTELFPEFEFQISQTTQLIANRTQKHKININIQNFQNKQQITQKINQLLDKHLLTSYFQISTQNININNSITISFCNNSIIWNRQIQQCQFKTNKQIINQIQSSLTKLFELLDNEFKIGKILFVQIFKWFGKFNSELDINHIGQTLKIPQDYLIYFNHEMQMSQIQQNDRKVEDPQELFTIFNKLRYSKQCRYTNKRCQQLNIIITKNNLELRNSFFIRQNTYMIDQDHIPYMESIFLIHLGFNFIDEQNQNIQLIELRKIWYHLEFIKILKRKQKQIKYLQYILKNKHLYTINVETLELIQQWKQSTLNIIAHYNQNQIEKLWYSVATQINILDDIRIGKQNIFPSDYKLGIYLPLFVPLFYPIVYLVRSFNKYA